MQAIFDYDWRLSESVEKFNVFDVINEIVFGKYLKTSFIMLKFELQKDYFPYVKWSNFFLISFFVNALTIWFIFFQSLLDDFRLKLIQTTH
jgi:hypothetical protein